MELTPNGTTQPAPLTPVAGCGNACLWRAPSQGAGAKTVTALSNEELTKAFLTHEEELSLLQSQLALVYKIPVEHGLSRQLLDSVKAWQGGLKNLRQGEPHPDGSCSVAVATVLLHEVTKGNPPANIDKAEYQRFLKVVDALINVTTAKTKLANEVVHCSARLNLTSSGLTSSWTSGLPSIRI